MGLKISKLADQGGVNLQTVPTFSPQFQEEFATLLRWRRDVRHFREGKRQPA